MKIGNGQMTSIWYDWWILDKPLCLSLEPHILQNQGLTENATVADLIENGQWILDRLNVAEVVKNQIQGLPISATQCDQPFWEGLNLFEFKSNKIWNLIRARGPNNYFKDVIWFKGHVPRCSFITWLAAIDRLPTLHRLKKEVEAFH